MARKKKQPLLKRILVIGLSLVAIQVALIFYFRQKSNPTDIREAISKQVNAQDGLAAGRREQMKVQLAVSDFRMTAGKLPASLNELVPKYFERIPNDPQTGKPFEYKVEGDLFFVGQTPAGSSVGTKPATEEANREQQEQDALIASLDAPLQQVAYLYDPTGKRDPFRPFNAVADGEPRDCEANPLTCWDIGQLKLTIVLSGGEHVKANIEDATGRGYIVQKGTKIGRNNGEIVEILPDRLKILETNTDFTGEVKTTVVEMTLRSKDIDKPGSKKGK